MAKRKANGKANGVDKRNKSLLGQNAIFPMVRVK